MSPLPGPTGKNGKDGNDGKDGKDGKDGPRGKDGVAACSSSSVTEFLNNYERLVTIQKQQSIVDNTSTKQGGQQQLERAYTTTELEKMAGIAKLFQYK